MKKYSEILDEAMKRAISPSDVNRHIMCITKEDVLKEAKKVIKKYFREEFIEGVKDKACIALISRFKELK